jgi:hypothetical protein
MSSPGQQPRVTREVVEQSQEGHDPTHAEEKTHETADVSARADHVDHQIVDGPVAEEDQRRVERLARRHTAHEPRGHRKGHCQSGGWRWCQCPAHERAVAEDELQQEHAGEERERKIERRAPPLQPAFDEHRRQPCGRGDRDEEEGDGEWPAAVGAGGQRCPDEQRHEGAAADGPQ